MSGQIAVFVFNLQLQCVGHGCGRLYNSWVNKPEGSLWKVHGAAVEGANGITLGHANSDIIDPVLPGDWALK